ncbi:MAG: DnaJ domain-containing protein [Spirochaetota bacterium]
MHLSRPSKGNGEPGRAGRANIRILVIGLVPPLLLMVLATVLDALFARVNRDPLFHSVIVYGSWACLATITGLLLKFLYLPWLLRDRTRIWNRALKTSALVLIAVVYASGYPVVALALALIGIIIAFKEHGEAARFGRKRAGGEADETSWYYVGEGRDETPFEVKPSGMDPYGVLGLAPGAGPEEVKAAYRKIIKECHPDLNGGVGDSARFRRSSEAYERLCE